MSKVIIDDVYKNTYVDEEKDIYSEEKASLSEEIKAAAKEKVLLDVDDETFERLLSKTRENMSKPLTKEEALIVASKLESTKKEAKIVLKKIRDKKEDFHNKIMRSEDKFDLDISRNTLLKRSANRVFGGNKTSITYEDYATLLEMRKQLQISESLDVLAGEDL